jgi:hypothetical protein
MVRKQSHKSLTHIAQETGVSLGPVFIATKLIKFHPYKRSAVHELKQSDFAPRNYFYNWLLQKCTTELWIHTCFFNR